MRAANVAVQLNRSLWLCLAVFVMAGCTKSSAPLNSANIMFVNGCLSATTVGVEANNTSVTGATELPFLTNSGYRYVTAGNGVYLTFFLGGKGSPFASQTENITASDNYSAFIGGAVGVPEYVFTADDLTPPSSGNAKLRFVNLSPDNINESVAANDTLIAQGVGNNSVSGFSEIAKGAYFITAFDPYNRNTVVQGDSMVFLAGKIYTIMLSGTLADSGSTSGLTLTVIKNN